MSKNYIYIKQSTDPVMVGDLISRGLILSEQNPDRDIYYLLNWQGEKELLHSLKGFRPLLPLLIMDAPEIINPPEKLTMKHYSVLTNGEGYRKSLDAIPFHFNEQVYKYLQSKGIKPEAEMLIQFDGEVKVGWNCLQDNEVIKDCCFMTGVCDQCKRVAIIKDTEVKEEESVEDRIKNILAAELTSGREIVDAIDAATEKLFEHFKIERRK